MTWADVRRNLTVIVVVMVVLFLLQFVMPQYYVLTLTRMTNNRVHSFAQIGGEGAAGIVLGLVAVALLAGGRFALEYWLGIPTPQ